MNPNSDNFNSVLMGDNGHMPELRFPEFLKDWEEKKIGNNYYLTSGQHLAPNEYTSINKGIGTPYFTGPSDFTNKEESLSKWTTNDDKSAIRGNILFTVKGSGVTSSMLLHLDKVAIGRQLMAIGSKSMSTIFLFHKLDLLKNYFVALASGNMIPGLSRKDILTTKIHFPSLPEQQKIADFLSTIDQKIQALTQKKELIEKFIEDNLPKIGDSTDIPDHFDNYWNAEKRTAFDAMCKDEGLIPTKLDKIINNYLFSGREPLRDAIIGSLKSKPSVLQRKSIGERVLQKMLNFVDTFINGVPSGTAKIYELPGASYSIAADDAEEYN